MEHVLVVYWSGTGNTKLMAQAVAEGAKKAGAEVDLKDVSEITPVAAAEYDRIAFGCPSMGAEVLEEAEMEPFFTEIEGRLSGKKVALFGSYGWGDGQWMRDWEQRVDQTGANLCAGQGLILNETPDDQGLAQCNQLGADLVTL